MFELSLDKSVSCLKVRVGNEIPVEPDTNVGNKGGKEAFVDSCPPESSCDLLARA